jgi:hypothetical protein
MIISGSGILPVMIGSGRKREHSATEYDHRILFPPIFRSFPAETSPRTFPWAMGHMFHAWYWLG